MAPTPKREVVVADANVLFSNDQRNIFMTLAVERIIELRWTDQIEGESVENLVHKRGGDPQKLARTAGLMRMAIPGYNVPDYRAYILQLTRTDEKDRHVAAAAIGCRPSTVATWNLKDFDAKELATHDVRVTDPDTLLCEIFDAAPADVHAVVEKAYGFVRKLGGKPNWLDYMNLLATSGAPCSLKDFADRLRRSKHEDDDETALPPDDVSAGP